jgi:folate-dependent phosphoribosylglycinamide formyltransferase PurN
MGAIRTAGAWLTGLSRRPWSVDLTHGINEFVQHIVDPDLPKGRQIAVPPCLRPPGEHADPVVTRTADVVLLTTGNDLGKITARRLAAAFPDMAIIVEQPVSRLDLVRSRVKRLGAMQVVGQLGFILLARALHRAARRRIADILQQNGLESRWPEGCERFAVGSVNSPECVARLAALKPRVVLLLGTRVVNRATLSAIAAPLINYHAGITPKYRGIHGGYWARTEGDLANFGVTVHLVDPGIDTGAVLYQARLAPSRADNYATFPYLQLAAALPLIEQAARDAIAQKLAPQAVDLPSRLWSHPTIWGYVAAGLRRGAW